MTADPTAALIERLCDAGKRFSRFHAAGPLMLEAAAALAAENERADKLDRYGRIESEEEYFRALTNAEARVVALREALARIAAPYSNPTNVTDELQRRARIAREALARDDEAAK